MSDARTRLHRAMSCAALVALTSCGGARTYDQTYLRASDNWQFRNRYPVADGLFNAFDYGHAILSETLIRHPADASRRLDGPIFRKLTCDVLRHTPTVPLEERAIGPAYATQYPEAVATFEWAHMLHRQIYDIIAANPFASEERNARVRAALAYYRSRPDLALSAVPKDMALMEGQPYSLAFRRAAPRFNRLIWSYHWLQMALYDALLDAPDPPTREANVARDVEIFRRMTWPDGRYAPTQMPMSAGVAPSFTEHYPDAAVIFDNLHSLHDVVSDVLTSPTVSPPAKRAAILLAIARYRDTTSFVTTREEWLDMSRSMGSVDTTAALEPAPACDRAR
jgi:hypothetical protein